MHELGPLFPFVLLGVYLAAAALSLVVHNAVSGRYSDRETEARGASVMLPMALRHFFMWAIQPLWAVVKWSGIPANGITTLSTLFAIASGVAAAAGDLSTAGWLYLGAGMGDVLDGRIAREAGTAGPRGAALDSVLDRYADAAVLAGLAYYLRAEWTMVLAIVALVGSLLVSYVRARGEGLGVDVKVGFMQRPERVVIIGSSLAIAPVVAFATDGRIVANAIVVPTIAFVAVMTQITALRRLAHVVAAFAKTRREQKQWSRVVPAVISAFVATAADFGLMSLLVANDLATTTQATALGCLLGGVINFSLNRVWTFAATDQVPALQAIRYTIVSVISALLNSGGVALALMLPLADYRIGWVLVRAAVFLCWNFPLQRDYVYGPKGKDRPELSGDEERPVTSGHATS
ncbi:MAG: GtrA family protein [Myxococcota bacterium]